MQFHHWEDTQFVSCLVERDDGFLAHGYSSPIDPADFDLEEGQRRAYASAVANLFAFAVSGFFERRAMLAGAHDVLDRCGVSGDDVVEFDPGPLAQHERDQLRQWVKERVPGQPIRVVVSGGKAADHS
ncbi:hypothetical protein BJP27_24360 (plasmid) [Pseudomonas oryzihabitans]|nr:hypothetical protein BJP27_24360 [Pseudomonas psychrotolerans]